MIIYNNLGRYGRLGNQMFQIASTIGIAIKNNTTYGFPIWKNYDHLDRFNSPEDINIHNYFLNKLPNIDETVGYSNYNIGWGYTDVTLDNSVNYNLIGHMQSDKYFSHCNDVIKHYFTLTDEIPNKNNSLAIHVRLGDYDGDYHPRLTLEEYYNPVIDELAGKFDKIYWFSDNIETLKTQVKNNHINIFVEGNHYMEDFKIMKSCNHFIIGNSTFSWWAAWLSNFQDKIVVAPKRWFGQIANISSNDLYCKDWLIR